jgi:PleD family two-component response regulator
MPPEDEEGKELYKSSEASEEINAIIESSENASSDSMKSSGSEDSNTQESQEVHEMQAIEEVKPKKDAHEEMPKNDQKHGINAVAKDQELAQQKYKKRIKACKDKFKNKKEIELGNIQVEEGVGCRLTFPSGYLDDSDLEGSVEWPAMTAVTDAVTQLVTVTPN